MSQKDILPEQASGAQRNALIAGVVGLLLLVFGFFLDSDQFYESYLLGYMYALQFPLGCLAILMIHHLAGGNWAFTIRRFLEAGALTIPLFVVLFIPILFGMDHIYHEWITPKENYLSLIEHKSPYLNVPFFIIRAVIYFVIWVLLAFLLNSWSREQDRTGNISVGRFKSLSAFGLIVLMLTGTFAAYDWTMSLQPTWFSSIYGVIYLAGGAVSTICLVLITGRALRNQEPFSERFSIYIVNDLGNFLLAFVSFWAYVSFSQFLIIWMANLPETITWYLARMDYGWQVPGLLLVFLHFAFPFLLLLSRRIKRNIGILVPLAMFILVMRWVDLYWQIVPAFYPTNFHLSWMDIAAPVGLTGLWAALYIRLLGQKPLLAQRDPRFQEAPAHG